MHESAVHFGWKTSDMTFQCMSPQRHTVTSRVPTYFFQWFSKTFPEYLTQFPGQYIIIISKRMSLIPMFIFIPSILATKTPTSVLWGKLLLKTADRQAHNATRCVALWACRSAIFSRKDLLLRQTMHRLKFQDFPGPGPGFATFQNFSSTGKFIF